MRNQRALLVAAIVPLFAAVTVEAQHSDADSGARAEVRLGIEAYLARQVDLARTHYERALAIDSMEFEARWRLAEVMLDIGKQTPDSVKDPARDSLYALAERQAQTAVSVAPDSANGYYVLSASIGRTSLTKSKKERVRRAGEIREYALRALAIEPNHDKATHIMGRWNAEIMRLSSIERFFAKNFLGGKIFNAASWDSAVVYMDRAVALAPANIYHRLSLAEILVDMKRYGEARGHLAVIPDLPLYDVMDPQYKLDAAALARRIEGKKEKGQ
jgi:tetratricopeptide (TPR) repeat protein